MVPDGYSGTFLTLALDQVWPSGALSERSDLCKISDKKDFLLKLLPQKRIYGTSSQFFPMPEGI